MISHPPASPASSGKPSASVTLVTLVTGSSALVREAAIWSAIAADAASAQDSDKLAVNKLAVILEGLPDGKSPPAPTHSQLHITRIAPGCFCCIGNLTLRVTLNRLLRTHPSRIYISIADITHLDKIHDFLSLSPYDTWLTLSDAITM
ncbi:GTPase [Glaciimonas sp. PCH181]|uniref:GTPase n=1 Tax=Glaciimonas sp. PCH181 TaxID=2133943 RepID=UPI000D33C6BF|nr:GTPase [Glaciimonas sp. PCH181]PUA17382.1 GTPase [Glaciimonas sp. PCH181]